MKKTIFYSLSVLCAAVLVFALYAPGSTGQEAGKFSFALPDSINKIVSVSCIPCHTDKGGLMSRTKLNWTNWTQYSPTKQKEKADLIRSMLEKDKMPPKEARQKRPEIILTREQVTTIINWTKSLKSM